LCDFDRDRTNINRSRICARVNLPANAGEKIIESVCRQGDFEPGTDKTGNPTYTPIRQQDGNVLPPSAPSK